MVLMCEREGSAPLPRRCWRRRGSTASTSTRPAPSPPRASESSATAPGPPTTARPPGSGDARLHLPSRPPPAVVRFWLRQAGQRLAPARPCPAAPASVLTPCSSTLPFWPGSFPSVRFDHPASAHRHTAPCPVPTTTHARLPARWHATRHACSLQQGHVFVHEMSGRRRHAMGTHSLSANRGRARWV